MSVPRAKRLFEVALKVCKYNKNQDGGHDLGFRNWIGRLVRSIDRFFGACIMYLEDNINFPATSAAWGERVV